MAEEGRQGRRIWAGAGRGISPIHALDRVLGVTHLVEGDEGEAARLVRLAVLGEEDVRDVPELLEGPDKTKRESRLVSTSRPQALPPPLFALVVLLHVFRPRRRDPNVQHLRVARAHHHVHAQLQAAPTGALLELHTP